MSAARRRRRLALAIALGGAALAAAVVAWPWLRANLVAPLTLTIWLLLRMLVLSIHQAVYWALLVLAVPVLILVVLYRQSRPAHDSLPLPAVWLARAHPVDEWRWLVEQTAGGVPPLPTIGWNGFVQLAVSLKAVERRAPPDYRLHDALRDGRLALPPEVHAFLFPPPPAPPRGLGARLRRWADAPGRAARRLSGRDRAERLRAMSRLLSFLEQSLEMTSHDDPDDAAHR